MTGCSTQKFIEFKQTHDFPQTFDEAEIYIESQFKPIEIGSSGRVIFISIDGDTIYVNNFKLTQLVDTSNTKLTTSCL